MSVMDRDSIIERLQEKLTERRFIHSVGVEYTAACMAYKFDVDAQKARIAGLLHDCAKCIPREEKLRKAEKFGLPVNVSERENPDLLHGKLGAYYARKRYGVEDPEILSAITYHTTGHPNMSKLDQIIFIADFIEPNRKMIPSLPEIRREAFTDLDHCMMHILKNTLDYLHQRNVVIDEMTQKTYDFYREETL